MTALKNARQIDLSRFRNNQTFIALDLRKLMDEDGAYIYDLWGECQKLLDARIIKGTVNKEIDFANYKQAYKMLEDRNNIGKIVVKVEHDYVKTTNLKTFTNQPNIPIVNKDQTIDIAVVGMSGQYGSCLLYTSPSPRD